MKLNGLDRVILGYIKLVMVILGITLSTHLVQVLLKGEDRTTFLITGCALIPLSVHSVFVFVSKNNEIISKHG